MLEYWMNKTLHINLISFIVKSSGWLCIIIYCLFTSISAVWVSMSFTQISGVSLTFFTLLVAQIIFLLLAIITKQQTFNFIIKINLLYFGLIFWLWQVGYWCLWHYSVSKHLLNLLFIKDGFLLSLFYWAYVRGQ